jgi:4-azaleucine resistance transporter AzlC
MTLHGHRSHAELAEIGGGARDVTPIALAASPFGMLFGALAAQADFSTGVTLLMSLVVYSGTMQVIGVNMMVASTPWPLVALASVIVNFRHVIYSAALTTHLRRLPIWWRLLLSYGMTDQIYALAQRRYSASDPSVAKHWYVLASSVGLFVAWLVSTYVGLRFGEMLGHTDGMGLDFAFYATLVALAAPALDNGNAILAGLTAGIVAVLLSDVPYQGGIVIAIVAGVAAGVSAERWSRRARA